MGLGSAGQPVPPGRNAAIPPAKLAPGRAAAPSLPHAAPTPPMPRDQNTAGTGPLPPLDQLMRLAQELSETNDATRLQAIQRQMAALQREMDGGAPDPQVGETNDATRLQAIQRQMAALSGENGRPPDALEVYESQATLQDKLMGYAAKLGQAQSPAELQALQVQIADVQRQIDRLGPHAPAAAPPAGQTDSFLDRLGQPDAFGH